MCTNKFYTNGVLSEMYKYNMSLCIRQGLQVLIVSWQCLSARLFLMIEASRD